jgi:hypothetical protein
MAWAIYEAHLHKYLLGLCAGHDPGPSGWIDWKLKYWPRFLGHRRYEHLRGERNWREFPTYLFGVAPTLSPSPLVDHGLVTVKWGEENLGILQLWAMGMFPGVTKEEIIAVLVAFHLNDMRPEFPDEPVAPPPDCPCRNN